MPNHLGLDLGTRLGWAMGEAQSLPSCGTILLPSFSDGWGDMLASYADWLGRLIREHRPADIFYEAILPTNAFAGKQVTNDATQRVMISLAATTELICYRASILPCAVPMNRARSHVIRLGKAGKGEVKGLVMSEMIRRGLKPDSDNASDAGAIWFYGETQILRRG